MHSGSSRDLDTETLIRHMVGREMADIYPARQQTSGEVVLETKGLSAGQLLKDASITLRRGEIVGLFGLAGSGRSELLRAIYAADPISRGEILIAGERSKAANPRDAIAKGLGLLPEDRKTQGLFLIQSVGFNILSASLRRLTKFGVLLRQLENNEVQKQIKRLLIKTPGADAMVQNLSGGNQQKCVFARQVSAGCQIILADEPTRGVDVGAKREIYDLLVELAETGNFAVLMASSELPEVLGICERIYVLREGKVVTELQTHGLSEETVMQHAALH